MNAYSFIKSKLLYIIIQLFVMAFTSLLLHVLGIDPYAIVFIIGLYLVSSIVVLIVEFVQKYNFYNEVTNQLSMLDKKYLLASIMKQPNFLEGEILHDILQVTNKSMNDHIAQYKIASEEYREYIETWVHEVKTPIASSKLIIENNPSHVTHSIGEEISKIDGFVEQALFYSRSNSVEKDYLIKQVSLESLVKDVIKKNAKALIESKFSIELNNLAHNVFTDPKWVDFILGQIIANSIKYKQDPAKISISTQVGANHVSLNIKDQGIGIPEKDISKVFDKGFTGQNGRKYAQSTGIGLYLCKTLCDKLGLHISLDSEVNMGVTVIIVFPINRMLIFES